MGPTSRGGKLEKSRKMPSFSTSPAGRTGGRPSLNIFPPSSPFLLFSYPSIIAFFFLLYFFQDATLVISFSFCSLHFNFKIYSILFHFNKIAYSYVRYILLIQDTIQTCHSFNARGNSERERDESHCSHSRNLSVCSFWILHPNKGDYELISNHVIT